MLLLFLHYQSNFEGKISNNDVCALILPAIGLTHRRTSFKLLITSENLTIVISWVKCPQSSSDKRGTHLADAFDIFKPDFNIICPVGFPQPVISAR